MRNVEGAAREGGYMTWGWTGVYHPVLRKVPSSKFPNIPVILTFMMNFGGK